MPVLCGRTALPYDFVQGPTTYLGTSMIIRFLGASAPFLFLGTSFLARGLFQSSIPVELEPDRVRLSVDSADLSSLTFLKTHGTSLKLSLSDFKPLASAEKNDRIKDAISSLRGEARAKSLAQSTELENTAEIDAVFNGSNASKEIRTKTDRSESIGDSTSSAGLYGIVPAGRLVPSLPNMQSDIGLTESSKQAPTRSRNFLANLDGTTGRTNAGFGGLGNGYVPNGTGAVSGGSGSWSGPVGGGGVRSSTTGITSTPAIQSSGLSNSSMLSNVDRFLSNQSLSTGSSDVSASSSLKGTTLLASSSRPQLTADGKFGIPNHQYWTFDFKDSTGPNGTPDGIVDRKDADKNFDDYLTGLQPKLEAASQVVKWNPTELRNIYSDLNTQIPSTDPAKSPSFLTFMIIDFPVKGFYLPKSGIPANPGLPTGALD